MVREVYSNNDRLEVGKETVMIVKLAMVPSATSDRS